MRIFGNILILIFFLLTAPSTADIKYGKIQSHDVDTIFIDDFGFTHTGHASVAVSSVSITHMPFTFNLSPPNLSRLGFYLLSQEQKTHFLHEFKQNPNSCVLDSKFIILLSTFIHLSPPPTSSFINSHPVTHPNHYSLFFANCNPSTQVSMDVRIELYNTIDAATKNYLSAGKTQLPSLYFIFGLIYLYLSGYWMIRCFTKFTWIHIQMGVFIVLKALTLLCASAVQEHVKVTGTLPKWVVVFYKMQYIGDMLCYILIVIVFMGRMELYSSLIRLIAIPLHVIPNVVFVMISYNGPLNEDLYLWIGDSMKIDAFYIFIIILLTGELIPKIWEANEKPVKKLTIGVCLYVIVGRLIVTVVMTGIVGYKYRWVSNAAEEIQSLLVYIILMFSLLYFPDREMKR